MELLITIDQARRDRKITGTREDDELRMKAAHAQAMILRYLSDTTDAVWTADMASWTDETVLEDVQAAILLQLGFLYRYRGDEPDETKAEHGDLAPGVKACLYRIRKPVIA